MLLLFVVSGFATRALLARSAGAGAFLRVRSRRLLLPLLFGACVIVVPQPWFEAREKLGYAQGFLYFWRHDYFDFDGRDGIATPALFHLWFVAYIWLYSAAVALAAVLLPGRSRRAMQTAFDRLARGGGLLLVPLAWLLFVRLMLLPGVPPTNRVLTDLPGHLVYLPAFLFGFALARSRAAWPAIHRAAGPALVLVVLGYAGLVWGFLGFPGATWMARFPARELAPASLMGWGAIILLLAAADRWLNRDHRWRAPLTEAVFPIYLIHQTLIVAIGGWLVRLRWGAGVEFIILIAGTVAGCWLFWAIGRRVVWLRPLIGLPFRPTARRSPPARAPHPPAPAAVATPGGRR